MAAAGESWTADGNTSGLPEFVDDQPQPDPDDIRMLYRCRFTGIGLSCIEQLPSSVAHAADPSIAPQTERPCLLLLDRSATTRPVIGWIACGPRAATRNRANAERRSTGYRQPGFQDAVRRKLNARRPSAEAAADWMPRIGGRVRGGAQTAERTRPDTSW